MPASVPKNYSTTDRDYIQAIQQYIVSDINCRGLLLCFTNWDPQFTDTSVTEKCKDLKTGTL